MAELVLGIGSSHSPMLATTAAMWADRLEGDRRTYHEEWDALVAERSGWIEPELATQVWEEKHARVAAAITGLGETLRSTPLDALIVIGDDQDEMLPTGLFTPLTVFTGASATDDPPIADQIPEHRRASMWSFYGDGQTTYPCHQALARHLVGHAQDAGFDVTSLSTQLPDRALGHAFTFVAHRLLGGATVPLVPVMLNTFFPQSQPTAARSFALGRELGRAVRDWPEPTRIGIVASGGLSHRIVDRAFDEELLAAMQDGDEARLLRIGEAQYRSGDEPCGNGESKNWIAVTAALAGTGLSMEVVAYESLYRTPAGTGVGAAFARWV